MPIPIWTIRLNNEKKKHLPVGCAFYSCQISHADCDFTIKAAWAAKALVFVRNFEPI